MAKVTFDYSKAESFISNDEVNSMKEIAENAKKVLVERTGAGNDFLGWIDLPVDYDKEEFDRIYAEVNSIHSHNYNDILTIHFKPFHCNLILDGRHRYTEFKKFKPDDSINVSFLDSNDFIDCIISASDLTNYIILNNIDEINNYILGKGKLEQVINFKLCNL